MNSVKSWGEIYVVINKYIDLKNYTVSIYFRDPSKYKHFRRRNDTRTRSCSFGIQDSFSHKPENHFSTTLHNSYKNSTSLGFIVEMSISFVYFEL